MDLGPGNHITLDQYLKGWNCFKYNPAADYSWIQYEKHSYVKYPVTHFTPPSPEETLAVFKATNTRLLGYAELCEEKQANAHWYACRSIDEKKISGSYMRNLKTARKNLTIKMVPLDEFYRDGFLPYAQLRQRKGLDDGTPAEFIKRFRNKDGETLHTIIGAYHQDKLVAYIPFLMFNDLVEIEGPYTGNEALRYCANELLLFTALDFSLNQHKKPVVSYGYSSIQSQRKDFKLHEFKMKVGFEAVPIKRHFIFNPKTRVFINPVTKGILKAAGILFPKNGAIRKINGVFEYTK